MTNELTSTQDEILTNLLDITKLIKDTEPASLKAQMTWIASEQGRATEIANSAINEAENMFHSQKQIILKNKIWERLEAKIVKMESERE